MGFGKLNLYPVAAIARLAAFSVLARSPECLPGIASGVLAVGVGELAGHGREVPLGGNQR